MKSISKPYLLNLNGWALTVECESPEQAERCANDIGAEYLGAYVCSQRKQSESHELKRFALGDNEPEIRLITKDEEGFERIVFAEMLIPDTLNSYNDFHTKESVREFAYQFMIDGFGVDIDHDNYDVSNSVHIIESFIARDDDPDFIPGSWVLGMMIRDDRIWNQIRNNELTGYSYEALVQMLPIDILAPGEIVRTGQTEPDLDDGHVHSYFVLLSEDGRVIAGGTDLAEDGHDHIIKRSTVTEDDEGQTHKHLYNTLIGESGY